MPTIACQAQLRAKFKYVWNNMWFNVARADVAPYIAFPAIILNAAAVLDRARKNRPQRAIRSVCLHTSNHC